MSYTAKQIGGMEYEAFNNRIIPCLPLPCPCCGAKDLRLENLVIEGVVGCRRCKLTIVRKHSDKDTDDGLLRAIFAWNFRFDFNRGTQYAKHNI